VFAAATRRRSSDERTAIWNRTRTVISCITCKRNSGVTSVTCAVPASSARRRRISAARRTSTVSCLPRFDPLLIRVNFGLQRSSVVRTSVFGWRTFPDLCLIYGWRVNTLWVKCPLCVNQPCQLAFHPFGVDIWVVIHVITWITRVETIKRQNWAAYGYLVIGQSL